MNQLRPRAGDLTGSEREAGMVSAELAAALTAVVLVLTLALSAVIAGIDLIRCTDAARVAARAAARGEEPAAVQRLAALAAPERATISVSGGDHVRVVVVAPVRGPLASLISQELRATAVAPKEWGDGSP